MWSQGSLLGKKESKGHSEKNWQQRPGSEWKIWRCDAVILEGGERTTSQRMWESSRTWKRHEEIFPRASRKKTGFPGGTIDKESSCRCKRHKRLRFDPWVGKIPWGNPLQYSCLENTMDRGAWRATVHRVTKSRTRLNGLACTHQKKLVCWHLHFGPVGLIFGLLTSRTTTNLCYFKPLNLC